MEYSHPDFFVTAGVNDVEQLKENFEIDRRDLHARNQIDLMKGLKQPQLVRHYQWERQFAKIRGDMTVAERSNIYLKESQSIADKLGVDDFAFTTGATHAAQMAATYKGKRRLVLIRPLHLYKPIMSLLHK
jgi:hypothetical protein